jgi:hypothetical protein
MKKMLNNKSILLRATQDYCSKYGSWLDIHFEFGQASDKCQMCGESLIQVSKIIEIPSEWKDILLTHRPDIAKNIIG